MEPAHVFGFDRNCALPECSVDEVAPIGPGTTIYPRLGAWPPGGGGFLFVEREKADRVAFGLRFRDVSRQGQTWGTEVPVVREREFRSGRISLLDIPVSPAFRHVLRIYEFDGVNEREVLLRLRAHRLNLNNVTPDSGPPADVILGETVLRLQFAPPPTARRYAPAYVAISDLSAIVPLGSAQRIALAIDPMT